MVWQGALDQPGVSANMAYTSGRAGMCNHVWAEPDAAYCITAYCTKGGRPWDGLLVAPVTLAELGVLACALASFFLLSTLRWHVL